MSSDPIVETAMVIVPLAAIVWAWHRAVQTPRTSWRERALLAAVITLTVDLLLYISFIVWPWFGAEHRGYAAWQRTVILLQLGFFLSAVTVVLSLGAAGKAIGRLVIVLSLAAAMFWLMMSVPAGDFRAAEGARARQVLWQGWQ